MIAVLQRASEGKVTVEDRVTGEIETGLVILLGVAQGDTEADAEFLADRIAGFRIFNDDEDDNDDAKTMTAATATTTAAMTMTPTATATNVTTTHGPNLRGDRCADDAWPKSAGRQM